MENETKENYWEQIQELLAETLGCGDIVSLSRWNESNSISADISLSSNLLKNTIHEVNDNVELIHYTSLSSLFEIINSKKLRFGNASQMNDPNELSFFLKSLNNKAIIEYKEQQKNIFIASFCQYDSKANDKGEHFSMWRNYGDNGNGVGIVFKLANKSLQSNWLDCALGKVDYNSENKSFQDIKKYFALLEKSKDENKFIVNNIPKIIYMLAALNKATIWSEEKEIRLLRYIKWEELQWSYNFNSEDLTKNVKATYVNGVVRYFTELDLDNRIRIEESKKISSEVNSMKNNIRIAESEIFDLYPALEIERIVFGYRMSDNAKHKVANAIRKLAYQNLGISIGFEDSSFTNYFKSEIDLE